MQYRRNRALKVRKDIKKIIGGMKILKAGKSGQSVISFIHGLKNMGGKLRVLLPMEKSVIKA